MRKRSSFTANLGVAGGLRTEFVADIAPHMDPQTVTRDVRDALYKHRDAVEKLEIERGLLLQEKSDLVLEIASFFDGFSNQELALVTDACGITRRVGHMVPTPEVAAALRRAGKGDNTGLRDAFHGQMLEAIYTYATESPVPFGIVIRRLSKSKKIEMEHRELLIELADFMGRRRAPRGTRAEDIDRALGQLPIPLSLDQLAKTNGEWSVFLPRSSLRDDGRRVLLEWGSAALKIISTYEQLPKALKTAPSNVLESLEGRELRIEMLNKTADRLCEQTGIASMSQEAKLECAKQAASTLMVGIEWARSGFPMVVPAHKLAASLMATKLPIDLMDEVRKPWPAFGVLVPDGLLGGDAGQPNGTRVPKTVGLMRCVDELGEAVEGSHAVWLAFDRGDVSVCPISNLKAYAEVIEDDTRNDEGDRLIRMLVRLLFGVAMELDRPFEREAIRSSSEHRSSSKKTTNGAPCTWTFELKRHVTLDLREWVRDYARTGTDHGRRAHAVRVLVRGHQKRQAYGPKSVLRKWIHVEPYWRGPDGGPIAVHEYTIGRTKGDSDVET